MAARFLRTERYYGITTIVVLLLVATGGVDGSGCPKPYIDNGYETHRSGKSLLFPRTQYRTGSSVFLSCNAGYTLEGSREVQCGSDSQWNQLLPYCTPVICPQPNIPHAFNTPQSDGDMAWEVEYIFLDTVKLQCDIGYQMRGRSEIKCGSDGKWSDLPACQPVFCPEPEIKNGHITPKDGSEIMFGAGHRFSDVVKVGCDAGYIVSGGSEIRCEADGKWSVLPTCEPADCGPPTALQFAVLKKIHVDKDIFPVGSTVTYSCLPGYVRIPGKTSETTCNEDSQWSEISEFCRSRTCGSPGEVQDGWFKVTGHIVGSIATLVCNKGYRIAGSSTQRHCLESGLWSNDIPNCEPLLCEPPPDIPNAVHSGMKVDKFIYHGSVSYSCTTGVLHGEQSIYCTEHGNWSAPAPECIDVSCTVPIVQNGVLQHGFASQVPYGDSMEFQCNTGYKPERNSTIRCGRDGMWHPAYPVCVSIFTVICPIPEIKNGYNKVIRSKKFTLEAGYRYLDTATMVCEVGFKMRGSSLVKCQADGNWLPILPTCEPVSCRTPHLMYGNLMLNHDGEMMLDFGPTFTGTVTVQCQSGYVILGEREIRCDMYGRLSALPTCVRVTCPLPESGLAHYILVPHRNPYMPQGYKFPDRVKVYCEAGYVINGSSEIWCEADRQWSSAVPTCEPVSCPTLEVRHGQILKNNGDTRLDAGYKFKDSFTVQCDVGYVVCGGKEVRCEADGKWSPAVPTCEPVTFIEQRSTPIPRLHVQTLLNAGLADEGRRSCHDKFLPLGRQEFTCMEKNTMDPTMARVVPASASALCESVGRTMKDHWKEMNVEDKYLHLEMGMLCLDIRSLHLQVEKLNATVTPSKRTFWQHITSIGFS